MNQNEVSPDVLVKHGTQSNILDYHVVSQALLASPDNGETLDFSHQNLTEIGEDGASELALIGNDDDESLVCRIALSYNRLTTLPVAFSLLMRLRYLNLRSNSLTLVPELTTMPSLEILDLSKNNIKRLPEQPGTLIKLQILSLSRNRLTRLPIYLSHFHRLNVLKIDHNPIRWPPEEIIDFPTEPDDPKAMQTWLRNFKHWLQDNGASDLSQDTTAKVPYHRFLKDTDPIISEEEKRIANGTELPELFPHSRTSSFDSTGSTFSNSSIDNDTSCHSLDGHPVPIEGSRPVSPTLSTSSTHTNSEIGAKHDQLKLQHSRTSSYSLGEQSAPKTSELFSKKSLPDLRTNNAYGRGLRNDYQHIGKNTTLAHVRPPTRRNKALDFQGAIPLPVSTATAHRESMVSERNLYFKRLSTHLSASTSETVSPSLLCLIDAIRGIYFAIHQIYEQVEHYTIWAFEDRVSTVLRKVLEPARTYMSQLTVALDKFDAIALLQKTVPAASICRTVLESCKDNIAVCGKVISALQLQLKVLARSDDVRFTRSLILMLYSSMAEISHSWHGVMAQIRLVVPLLQEHRAPPTVKQCTTTCSGFEKVQAPTATSGNLGKPLDSQVRSRNARRHAGSFSIRDVEIGRSMSSYVNPIPLSDGKNSASSGLTISINGPESVSQLLPRSQSSTISGSIYDKPSLTPDLTGPSDAHSPTPSRLCKTPAMQLGYVLPSGPMSAQHIYDQHLDIPNDSSRLVDHELLETITSTAREAHILWLMIEDILSDCPESVSDLIEALRSAMQLTDQLTETIACLGERPDNVNSKAMFDKALLFIKAVAQVSLELKGFGATHALPSTLRVMTAKVAQSTKDVAVLLHVSSYSASSSSTPVPHLGDDAYVSTTTGSGGTNLLRSRSAQPVVSSKMHNSSARDIPRSALPNQKFSVPTTLTQPNIRNR